MFTHCSKTGAMGDENAEKFSFEEADEGAETELDPSDGTVSAVDA